MAIEQSLEIVAGDAPQKLDLDCYEALRRTVS
jgi:hypothetical protein